MYTRPINVRPHTSTPYVRTYGGRSRLQACTVIQKRP